MEISERLKAVHQRIDFAAQQAGRSPDAVKLVAVSKTKSASMLSRAWLAGQRDFAESYVQEAMHKQKALAHFPVNWHFIGPLQSNKTAYVANAFSWVHSVDRYKIAKRLSEQRDSVLPPLNICLQINLNQERSKKGLLPDQAFDFAQAVNSLPHLKFRGLMVIPERTTDFNKQRSNFKRAKNMLNELSSFHLDTISMGMSADLEAAVLEGSTIVRVGTAVFGARN